MTDLAELARATNADTNPHRREHHVTVAQLRELLAGQPGAAIVILAKDGEGNAYSPLSLPIGPVWYRPETTWSGEVYAIGEETDGDVEGYEPDGDELFAVVLDPTN